eukprot:scaffold74187_cov37-Attheya_sp.AAC.3
MIVAEKFHLESTDHNLVEKAYQKRFVSMIDKPAFEFNHEGVLICNIKEKIIEAMSLLQGPLDEAIASVNAAVAWQKLVQIRRYNAAEKAMLEWVKQGTPQIIEADENESGPHLTKSLPLSQTVTKLQDAMRM